MILNSAKPTNGVFLARKDKKYVKKFVGGVPNRGDKRIVAEGDFKLSTERFRTSCESFGFLPEICYTEGKRPDHR